MALFCCYRRCFRVPDKPYEACERCESPTYCHCSCETYREIQSQLGYCCPSQCVKEPFWQVYGLACHHCQSWNFCRCRCHLVREKRSCIPATLSPDMHLLGKRLATFPEVTVESFGWARDGFFVDKTRHRQPVVCYACGAGLHGQHRLLCPTLTGDTRMQLFYAALSETRDRLGVEKAVERLLKRKTYDYTVRDVLDEMRQPKPKKKTYCCSERCQEDESARIGGVPCRACRSYGVCRCKCVTYGYCCKLHCFKIDPSFDQVDGLACRACGSFSYCRCKCQTLQFQNKRFQYHKNPNWRDQIPH